MYTMYVTPEVVLGCHVRFTCEAEKVLADNPEGAAGAVAVAACVVALAVFDPAELPAADTAVTVKE
jgi:hypothetical protein